MRLKSAELRVFSEQLFEIKLDTDCPKLSCSASQLALDVALHGVPSKEKSQEERTTLDFELGSFEVHSFKAQNMYSLVKPRQLNPMQLKQEFMMQPAASATAAPLMTPNRGIPSLAKAYNRTV